jgi:ubiquitin-protein ligase E3 D
MVSCSSCDYELGHEDALAEGLSLDKWSLRLADGVQTPEQFPNDKWISSRLLSLIERSGVRKVAVDVLLSTSTVANKDETLLLWIFSEDLRFSSSTNRETRRDPTRAMKVFWQPISPSAVAGTELSIEHLGLPSHNFHSLRQCLESSAQLLPQSARQFQQWHVGLLQRFDYPDVGMAAPEVDDKQDSPVEPFGKSVDIEDIPGATELLE